MTTRASIVCVLLAAAVPGLLFAPVFGVAPLLLPIAAVLAAGYAVAELCLRVTALAPWRPLLALLAGLIAVAETELGSTTAAGLPTGATARALVAGVTDSWQLALQSTWPARADADLMLFVPLAVLVAAVLGVELLRLPLVALLPSLVLLGFSQAYVAQTGSSAVVAALCYAVVAGGLLVSSRPVSDVPAATDRHRLTAALLVVPTVVLSVAAAVLVTAVDRVDPRISLQHNESAPLPPTRVTNPLDGIAGLLQRPDQPVFSYTSAAAVDRWRLVVLSEFDGASWSQDAQFRRMGTTLAAGVSVPTEEHRATVSLPGTDQPWVPSQELPAGVTGLEPLIDQDSGMLVVPGRSGPVRYDLSWYEPSDAVSLDGLAVDAKATTGFEDLGVVPDGIRELADQAVGGHRPSFQTALVLERWLSDNYQVATGKDLPTGSGWPQLSRFLLQSKRGTSEQFAASYVVLARLVGIPARLVVGFRAPAPGADGQVVVRNQDVLAWPEVAVSGVGWVPLDPTGKAKGAGPPTGGLAAATDRARVNLPPPSAVPPPQLPPSSGDDGDDQPDTPGPSFPWLPLLLGIVVLMVLALLSIPLTKAVRGWRRRRVRGAQGVVEAWREARDRLRAHGVPFAAGMTVRDLAAAAAPYVDRSVVDGLEVLAGNVDIALWSRFMVDDDTAKRAWGAVRVIRKGLAKRPFGARVKAAFRPLPVGSGA